jgi:hypothetical protein
MEIQSYYCAINSIFLVENDYYFSRMIIFGAEFRRDGWAKVNTIKKIND